MERTGAQMVYVVLAVVVALVLANPVPAAHIYSWGNNDEYQLGFNDTSSRSTPELNHLLSSYNISKIAAGEEFALGLTADGQIYAWGNNEYGQCGVNSTRMEIDVPQRVPIDIKIVDIVAGETSSFAISESGDVYSWGLDTEGVLGHNNLITTVLILPKKITSLSEVQQISVRGQSAFALESDKRLWSWGSNAHGQLCHSNSDTKYPNLALSSVIQVAAGNTHTLVLFENNTVYSCGSNDFGELGRTPTAPTHMPGLVDIGFGVGIDYISAGTHTSFALSKDNRWYGWGNNEYGQLGIGSLNEFTTPQEVVDIFGKGRIAQGEMFVLFLSTMSSSFVYSWGNGTMGELGTNNISSLAPKVIANLTSSNILQISAGSQCGFALFCACINGGTCKSENPFDCECPEKYDSFMCKDCSVSCGHNEELDTSTCTCFCPDGVDCTTTNESNIAPMLLILGTTVAILLLIILLVIIVVIIVVIVILYLLKTQNAQRFENMGSEMQNLAQPFSTTVSTAKGRSLLDDTPDASNATNITNATGAPNGETTKMIGGWQFSAGYDDDDEFVRVPTSHSIELSSPDLKSPYVVVPQKPYQCITDIGFEENLNPRHRQSMEDGHCMITGFAGIPTSGYFAIYDGHGGTGCVEFVQAHLHNIIQEEIQKSPNSINTAFKNAYSLMDSKLESKMGGATSITVLVRNETDPNTGATIRKLYSANCGDARTVLCRDGKAIRITRDHKASDDKDDKDEAERIRAQGGFIARNRVNGVLAVTRSFGDHNMKTWIISDPYQTEWTLTEADSFLILACDGLWDVAGDQEVVDYISMKKNEGLSAQEIATAIVDKALEERTKDNVSVMVIFL